MTVLFYIYIIILFPVLIIVVGLMFFYAKNRHIYPSHRVGEVLHENQHLRHRILWLTIILTVVIACIKFWPSGKSNDDERKELAAKESAMIPNHVRPGVTDSVSTGYHVDTIIRKIKSAADTITVYQRLGETMYIYLSADEMVDCLMDNSKTIHTFDGSAPYEDISSMQQGHYKFRFFRHRKNLTFSCTIQRY